MSHSTNDITPSYSTGPLGSAAPSYPSDSGYSSDSTKDVAKEQAANVGQEAKASGQHVADVAKDQASNVVGETTRQAKDLLAQGRGELANQAAAGHQRATSGLSTIAQELRDLAEGRGGSSGIATNLITEASDRLSSAVTWLEAREPSDLVSEVTNFARRRPGTFLAVAAGVGLLAGRLTRGVVAAGHDDEPTRSTYVPTAPVTSTGPASAPASGTSPSAGHYVAPDDLTGVATSADVLADPGLRVAR